MKANKNPRREADFYPTPPEAIESLLNNYPLQDGSRILEPCAGDGAISSALYIRYYLSVIYQVEINSKHLLTLERYGDVHIKDFLDCTPEKNYNYIITNPPFSLAQEFILKSLEYNCTVIMLLRLNFLVSQTRPQFWQDNPPSDVLVLSKRPSFTGDGKTDGQEYAWFVWNGVGEGIKVI